MRLAYNRGAALFLPDRFPGADILTRQGVGIKYGILCYTGKKPSVE